jgi:hypothetical protein
VDCSRRLPAKIHGDHIEFIPPGFEEISRQSLNIGSELRGIQREVGVLLSDAWELLGYHPADSEVGHRVSMVAGELSGALSEVEKSLSMFNRFDRDLVLSSYKGGVSRSARKSLIESLPDLQKLIKGKMDRIMILREGMNKWRDVLWGLD